MFGGMVATTWVQIVKAVLLLIAGFTIGGLVLARFGFDLNALLARAASVHPNGVAILAPQFPAKDPLSAFSLGLALMLGTAGLPHILMRFFTVPDARAARLSVFWAATFMNAFFALIFLLGFGAVALTAGNPAYVDAAGLLRGGGNMAAIHLSHAVGGDAMMGFVSAVAFATILAVVAGLTLAGASAISHDLYAQVIARGRTTEKHEVNLSKISAVVIGIVAIYLGYVFENQNVAFMVGLAFAVAASCNFPVLAMSILWRGTTTWGALAGGLVGLLTAVIMVVLSKAVWVATLGNPAPLFPYDNPALFSMPLAFATIWIVSLMDRSRRAQRERAAFEAQYVRSETGIGASGAHAH